MRCFISIELPEALKKDLDKATVSLRAAGAEVKWVSAENLHLTLKFLGDTPEELLPEIKKRLSAISPSHNRFRVRLAGGGVFPDRRRPKVVWVGVENPEPLIKLQRDIEKSLKGLGFKEEDRAFKAHLTFGRVKSVKGRDGLLNELDKLRGKGFGEFEAGSVSVMKSELNPKGSKYFRLFDIPIGL